MKWEQFISSHASPAAIRQSSLLIVVTKCNIAKKRTAVWKPSLLKQISLIDTLSFAVYGAHEGSERKRLACWSHVTKENRSSNWVNLHHSERNFPSPASLSGIVGEENKEANVNTNSDVCCWLHARTFSFPSPFIIGLQKWNFLLLPNRNNFSQLAQGEKKWESLKVSSLLLGVRFDGAEKCVRNVDAFGI